MPASLGHYLKSIRQDRQMTLREVEEATDKSVSNAYLSQIENNRIRKPNPNIIYILANLYAIDFENLMGLAGYIMPKQNGRRPTSHPGCFSEHNLTPEEVSALEEYLRFLRSR